MTTEREGRCASCDCNQCRTYWRDLSNQAAKARDKQTRCWSCSCGLVSCYTTADVAEYGEPSECGKCCRESLVECDQPRPSAAPIGDEAGMVLVPRVPTEAMVAAGERAIHHAPSGTISALAKACFAAMLAALPGGEQ